MSSVPPRNESDSLMQAIRQAIESEAAKLQEEAIKDAVDKFERALRAAVGGVAVNVGNFYSMQVMGPELVIHVKIEK